MAQLIGVETTSTSSWMNFTLNLTSTTTSPVVLPPALPRWVSWVQYSVLYLTIAGFSGTIMNAIITVCVVKNRKFRTRFYIIVGYLSLTRAITSFYYIVLGSYKISMMLDPNKVFQYRFACNFINIISYYSITDVLLLIFMVVDRMVAILQPIRYRLFTNTQATVSGGVIQIVSILVHVVPLFFGPGQMEVVSCTNGQSGASAGFAAFCNFEPLALTILLLLLQLVAVAATWRRLRTARQNAQESENSVFLKRQVELMRTLANMVLSHSVLTLLCRICLLLFGVLASLAVYFAVAVAAFQTFDIFISPIILLCSKKDLRQECLARCRLQRIGDSLNGVFRSGSSTQKPRVVPID